MKLKIHMLIGHEKICLEVQSAKITSDDESQSVESKIALLVLLSEL